MADGTLVFFKPHTAAGKLVFGDDGGGSVVTPAELQIDAEFAHDRALPSLRLAVVRHMGIDAAVANDDALPELQLWWDANVSRVTHSDLRTHWKQAESAPSASLRAHWQEAQPARHGVHAHWQAARPVQHGLRTHWQESERVRDAVQARWQEAKPLRGAMGQRWQEAERLRASLLARWQEAEHLRGAVGLRWQETLRLRGAMAAPWGDAEPRRAALAFGYGGALPVRVDLRVRWQEAMRLRSGVSKRTGRPQPQYYDQDRLGRLVFIEPWTGTGKLVFTDQRAGTPVEPPIRIVIPARRYYMVVNEVDLRRVDGNLSLFALDLSLDLSPGQWTWSWSATLMRQAESRLEDLKSGGQVVVQALINGVPYRLLAEEMERDRSQFPIERIKVKGRGLAAELDGDASPVLNFGNEYDRTAQQLANDALTLNGVSIGWTVDWGIEDWLVPAGAWLHRGSYISAINTIAGAAGAYVLPHATDKTLRILHRYPLAPWDWDFDAMDNTIDLAAEAAITEGVRWAAKPAYNRIYVGGETGGRLAQITRAGTAGDMPADPITDPLITHIDAARQRGRAELSDTGPQAIVTLGMQVRPDTGLILPGTFLRRTDGAEVLQGYVRGMRMSWQGSTGVVRQSVEVQTHA